MKKNKTYKVQVTTYYSVVDVITVEAPSKEAAKENAKQIGEEIIHMHDDFYKDDVTAEVLERIK